MKLKLFNRNNNSLKTVYDDDLVSYLKSIGLHNRIMNNDVLCVYCGNPITLDNLEVIVPKGKDVEIVCNNKNCLNQI